MAVMYPSAALLSFPSPRTNGLDPKLSAAVCRGYNDWLSDFCSHDPDRMKGVAAVPVHDVEESVIEIRRAVTEQGLVGAFVRSNVINGRNLHDPFYSELESLNIPLVVHEGTAGGAPGADQRFYGSWLMMHMAAHPLEQMLASESIIVGGVLERHPKLRVAFLEAGCSWLVYWLWRLDEELEAWGWHEAPELKERPTEYFLRQCFASPGGRREGYSLLHRYVRRRHVAVGPRTTPTRTPPIPMPPRLSYPWTPSALRPKPRCCGTTPCECTG